MLAILALVLAPLSRSWLTVDPLIAEAKERARERRELIVRLATAALILGTTLAGAVLLQHLRYVENRSSMLDQVFVVVRPWWVNAATVALCLLGAAGTADALTTSRRAITSGYAAASGLLVVAGLAAVSDTRLVYVGIVGWPNFGHTNLAIALLLLGLVSAVLALTGWSRQRQ